MSRHLLRRLLVVGAVAGLPPVALAPAAAQLATEVAAYVVVQDSVPDPLDGRVGDAKQGRRIVLDRTIGNCLICHALPESAERFMGDLGPDLSGVAARLSIGQIRLRLIDQSRINPATIMPPYHRTEGLARVAAQWRDKPILSSQQIEDVLAYLASLK
jgi:sulfur-oxidizing protein SoxX